MSEPATWAEAWTELLDELEPDESKTLQDVATLIYAGLDQARSSLDMPWGFVSHKRMIELSQRIAVETRDWTPYDGILVGTWMAASSRHQIQAQQEEG